MSLSEPVHTPVSSALFWVVSVVPVALPSKWKYAPAAPSSFFKAIKYSAFDKVNPANWSAPPASGATPNGTNLLNLNITVSYVEVIAEANTRSERANGLPVGADVASPPASSESYNSAYIGPVGAPAPILILNLASVSFSLPVRGLKDCA